MRLFDETESKYYELISYLLLQKRSFTGAEVDRLYAMLFAGDKDFEVLESLFPKQDGREVVFTESKGVFSPILNKEFPVRCTQIEQQAFRSLGSLPFADNFLSEQTIQKINDLAPEIQMEWDPKDIFVKNQFAAEQTMTGTEARRHSLSIIARAINDHTSIVFDNIKEGSYEYHDTEAFPVKIEYSFINDRFRISAYLPGQERFFKMTFDTMRNIRPGNSRKEGVREEYKVFLDSRKRKLVLEVEPKEHAIERCFRIFSFYEREAVYDKEENRYILEIHYYSFDEAEVIRDILSLGSSVTVLKPVSLGRRVYRRILKAESLYIENN